MLSAGFRNKGFPFAVTLLFLSLGVIVLTTGRPLLRTNRPEGEWALLAGLESAGALIAITGGVSCLAFSFRSKKRYYFLISLGFMILAAEGVLQGSLLTRLADLRGGIDYSRYIPFTHVAGKTVFAVFLVAAFFHEKSMSVKGWNGRVIAIWIPAALLIGIGIVVLALSIDLPRMIFPDRIVSRPFELIPALLFLLAFLHSLSRNLRSDDPFPRLMIVLFLLNALSHGCLAISKGIYDLRASLSFGLNLIGYVIPIYGIAFQSIKEMNTAESELSERRKAEKELTIEKRKLEAVAENIPVGVALVSRSLELLWANPFFKLFFEGIERPAGGYPIHYAEEVLKLEEGLTAQEQIGADREGNPVWAQIDARPIRDDEGRITSVMEMILPISERKRAELRLKTSEDRFSSFMDRSTEGFMLLDQDLRVFEANAAMRGLIGAAREDIIGKPVSEILAWDKANEAECYRTVETGEPFEREDVAYRTPAGRKSFTVKAFRLEGGLGMVVQDTTERRRAYEELVSARKAAEEANRAKSGFLANISHELRTPMNAIIGIPNMLMKRDTSNLNATQKEGLVLIYESGKKLLGLIDNILDLSKIEAGMMELYLESFPLDSVLSDLEKMAAILIGQKKVTFRVSKERSVPQYIHSDATKLNQILINLIGNSIKFTESGTILLKVRAAAKRLSFKITDTGIGIGEEDLAYVFGEYRQGRGQEGKKYHGTGLGLALSRRMIELMGGEIRLESRRNVGTTVTFHIPLEGQENGSRDAAAGASGLRRGDRRSGTRRAKPKVLVAEDEEIGRVTIRMILEETYDLSFAKNGAEALEKFRRTNPDLVLMDIMMPEIDGFRAFDLIRSREQGAKTPIIALTARAMREERKEILAHGFTDYVSKPIDDEHLLKTIEKHLRGGRR